MVTLPPKARVFSVPAERAVGVSPLLVSAGQAVRARVTMRAMKIREILAVRV
jgi:hypothetical protein